MSKPRFLCLDDFYKDPFSVREQALASSFTKSKHTPWPGLVSTNPFPGMRETLERIATLVSPNRRLDWHTIDAQNRFWGENTCGQFRSLFETEGVNPRPHAHLNGEWTAIIGLTLPQLVWGGTVFFRHRATNSTSSERMESGLYKDLIEADGEKVDAWEPIGIAKMGFNRLIVFDSRQFHSYTPGFGKCINDCRLIQIFDFTTSDP